ncbi:MAG: tRNA (adenosine(37)-N6)-threonylcarbamoyltransferase complex dimerization subunit type 1 TsaB [Elusimicrobia bacterium]|nr:tRNA (adenosine(37)-N6)-threonylcarbamoyltransferase complex dimerization subunit type 1 TsaB [Elusimicrobiota bacterium]MDE2313122.1 tRNA (adenosine(37)-N6)-threonylcarbamoyltransferase complex dimerization subunit type 1 TsaB [Elusimicrobiota bacterium]
MNILAVDSSGPDLSVALLSRGKIYSLSRRGSARPHDETIFPAAAEILRRARLALKDLDAVAAAAGPGRFTGIRIGMAYAAVTAGTLGVPALSVSRLEAAAFAFARGGRRCPALTGPRGEVFHQGFSGAAGRAPTPAAKPAWAEAAAWPAAKAQWEKRGFAVFEAAPGARDLLAPAAAALSGGKRPAFEPLYLKTAGYEKRRHPTGPAC